MYSKKRKYGSSHFDLKKGKYWYYQTYTYLNSKNGRKRLESIRLKNTPKKVSKVELEKIRRLYDDEYDDIDFNFRKGVSPFSKPPTQLSRIVEYYIEDCRKKVKLGDMSDSTLRFNKDNVLIFSSWYIDNYNNKSVDKITTSEIDEFRSHRIGKGLSPNTVSINLRNLRGFLNWCVKQNYIDVSPFTSDITIPKYRSRLTDEVLLNGDWKRFYTTIENSLNPKIDRPSDLKWNKNKDGSVLLDWYRTEWFKGILWVMCNSGMRGGEVRILKWKKSKTDSVNRKVSFSHFDKEMKKICIFFKGGYGEIPISPKLKPYFEELSKIKGKNIYVFQNPKGAEGYGKDIFNKYFREAMKSFGWEGEGYRPHSIRHSVVSDLIKKDVNPYSISKLCRHTDIRTTFNIYGHLLPSDLGDVMEKIGV